MLTARQRDLLTFIADYQREHGGVSPSNDEMADALALVSKSNVTRLLDGLESRGFIRRLAKHARAIEILDPSSPRPAEKPYSVVAYCLDPDSQASRDAFYRQLESAPRPLPYQPVEAA